MKRFLSVILVFAMVISILGFNIISPITSLATSTINIGDYVQMGSYYGEPILWRCVDIDENGPLMLADKVISIKPYDAGGDNTANNSSHGRTYNNGEYRKLYGSDYWADSNMRSWLNSTDTAGNVVWLCGNAPTNDKVLSNNSYATEKGFMADGNFTASERNAIKTVTQKSLLNGYENSSAINSNYHIYDTGISTVVQNYNTAYSEQVTDKMFLLDVKQVNKVYQNGNILGNSYYIGQPTQKAVDNSAYKDSGLATGNNWHYWLRSPLADHNSGGRVRFVSSGGTVDYYGVRHGFLGVRPAFYINLSSTSFKSGTGTVMMPYVADGGAGITPTTIPYPVYNNPSNNHSYFFFDNYKTWDEAKAYCESIGGHLATITSSQENGFLKDMLVTGTKSYYWLGGTDRESEMNFKWITGEAFTYSNWISYDPDNYIGDDVIFYNKTSGLWDDDIYYGIFSKDKYGFICEWDALNPTPTPTLTPTPTPTLTPTPSPTPTPAPAQTAIQPSLGSGTQADPFLISNIGNLYWLALNNSAMNGFNGQYFKQTANIDISCIPNWTPIGNNNVYFQGNYDGGGYTISGLTYSGMERFVGLFGFTTATIKNLAVTNIKINITSTNSAYLGNVPNCGVGGLCGYSSGEISNCYSTGLINVGTDWNIGGLVGDSYNSGLVANCYSTVNITGSGYSIGGVVGGTNGGKVYNCFSTGSLNGFTDIGGVLGYNVGYITNCYSINPIIIGNNTGNSAACYQNSLIAFYKSLLSFTTSSNWHPSYPWDFTNTWAIDSTGTINNGYPYLISTPTPTPGTIYVGSTEAYTTIQSAVNAANPGDTIIVKAGKYNEHLTIDKSNLTIQGESKEAVIIDGDGTDNVVSVVSASGNNINNLTITNGKTGIQFDSSNSNIISSCIVNNNQERGVFLNSASSNNKISNCSVNNNALSGIDIRDWQHQLNNVIENNSIYSNRGRGVLGYIDTNGTIVRGNEIYANKLEGILCGWSSWTIENNIVYQNGADGGSGIGLDTARDTVIKGNKIYGNYAPGVWLGGIPNTNNVIELNNIYSNPVGIQISGYSDNDTIRNNMISTNEVGLQANENSGHGNNYIYSNDFIYNTAQATDIGANNFWNNDTVGNYWSDYTGQDLNGDGKGDTPYIIPGSSNSKDNYPAMASYLSEPTPTTTPTQTPTPTPTTTPTPTPTLPPANSVTMFIPNIQGIVGKDISVQINLDKTNNASAVEFNLNYDANILEYKGYTNGDLASGSNSYFDVFLASPGIVTVGLFGGTIPDEGNDGGNIVTLNFKVKDTASGGISNLILTNTNLYDFDGNSIALSVLNGSVNVIAAILGDTNGDGLINIVDAQFALQFAVGLRTPTEQQIYSADVNHDGTISSIDALKIYRYYRGQIASLE